MEHSELRKTVDESLDRVAELLRKNNYKVTVSERMLIESAADFYDDMLQLIYSHE